MADVEIVIKTIDDASDQIKKLSSRIEELEGKLNKGAGAGAKMGASQKTLVDQVQSTISKFSKLITIGGAATIAVNSLRKAFEFGEQGAAINQTAESFDLLMKTVGASSDMLQELRSASKGTVDDLTLMRSTATLLAGTSDELGKSLADAAPQILELAKAANKLNPTLGDTAFLYESLMTGIKRGSPMLIDNTGLTLKLGEANEKMAAKLGKSVEQLTSEEQKLAILNATLEAGDNLLRQVGGNTDSATDSYARLGVTIDNLTNSFKQMIAPELEDQVNGLSGSLEVFALNLEELRNGESIFEILARNQERYAELETKLENNKWIKGWQSDLREAAAAAKYAEDNTSGLEGAIDSLTQEVEGYDAALKAAQSAQSALFSAQASYKEGVGRDLVSLLKDAEIEGQDYKDALAAIDAAQGTNFATTERMNEEMKKLVEKYKSTGDLAAFKQGIENLSGSFEPFNDKIREAETNLGRLKKQLDALDGREVHVGIYVHQNGTIPTAGGGTNPTSGNKDKYLDKEAAGGNVRAGETVLVGEFGPELFRPQNGGTIQPTNSTLQNQNSPRQGIAIQQVVIHVSSTDPRGAAYEIEAILGDQARIAQSAGAQFMGR